MMKEKMKESFFLRKNVSEPSNRQMNQLKNVSKKIPSGRNIPPLFFESSESYRVLN